jgi:hypothetical protein
VGSELASEIVKTTQFWNWHNGPEQDLKLLYNQHVEFN